MPKSSSRWQISTIDSRPCVQICTGIDQGRSQGKQQILLLINGRSEWIGKYADIRNQLHLSESVTIISWDHRGQGQSSGKTAHIDDYQDYLHDAKAVIDHFKLKDGSYGILAHSMGGLIALYGTLTGLMAPKFLILSSPLLLLPNSPYPRSLTSPISKGLDRLGIGKRYTSKAKSFDYENNPLTSSHSNFLKLSDNPRAAKAPTFSWVAATYRACDQVWNRSNIAAITCPLLLLGGDAEQVVDYQGFSLWTQLAAQNTDASFIKIPGARHELLNESPIHRQRIAEIIKFWLTQLQDSDEINWYS